MMKNLITLNLAGVLLAGSATAAKSAEKVSIDASKLPPPATRQEVAYAKDIKPLFDQSCTRCHGVEKPKAKLRLDNLDGILKGGEGGKVIKPGDSAASPLVHSIAHVGDPDAYMPPLNNKAGIKPLTPEQVGLVRTWIDRGAK